MSENVATILGKGCVEGGGLGISVVEILLTDTKRIGPVFVGKDTNNGGNRGLFERQNPHQAWVSIVCGERDNFRPFFVEDMKAINKIQNNQSLNSLAKF